MGTRETKPKLVPVDQINRIEEKGIMFDLMTKEAALAFLANSNNYFKLTSYRKNYPQVKREDGKFIYVNLDFLHLVELSRMDMLLRYQLLRMCLDIEHNLKIGLIRNIEMNDSEDGYDIVSDFINSCCLIEKVKIVNEIKRNANSVYYYGLLKKHLITSETVEIIDFPVWAFIEVISFGTLVNFMIYYNKKNRIYDSALFHFLNKVRQVRNACAHNTCMLNNLYSVKIDADYTPNMKITKFLGDADVKKEMRSSRLSNEVLYQIVVVLFVHMKYVTSSSIKERRYDEFSELMRKNMDTIHLYFSKNDLIASSFEMLSKVSIHLDKIGRLC